jgi:V8-like Glu-specific endopeptidase
MKGVTRSYSMARILLSDTAPLEGFPLSIRSVSWLTLLTVFSLAACSPGGSPLLRRSQRGIINGSVDTTHTAVVALVSYGETFCTGTLIGPHTVVSAGHCKMDSGLTASEISVFFGTTVGGSGTSIAAKDWQAHPSYYEKSDGTPMYDVSVITLNKDASVTPMAWQSSSLGNIAGQSLVLVGYGVTNAYQQTGSGTRRQITNKVLAQDSNFVYYGSGVDGTCQGDSGGPAFLDVGGTLTVVGVTSFGDVSCIQAGANTRLDAHSSFVWQFLGGCTANCTGKKCGADGCGGSCGTCSGTQICSSSFQCVTGCTPSCSGKKCGSDGCGGSCGTCTGGTTCNSSGQCVGGCTRDCSGKQCGDDGCGGTCGSCSGTKTCNTAGQCVTPSCISNCVGKQCGDDGCGGSCGSCSGGGTCNSSGRCVGGSCTAACNGKQCGPDDCGGTCGTCIVGGYCSKDFQCIDPCVPACDGKECGDDGCGGACGGCADGQDCDQSNYTCVDSSFNANGGGGCAFAPQPGRSDTTTGLLLLGLGLMLALLAGRSRF